MSQEKTTRTGKSTTSQIVGPDHRTPYGPRRRVAIEFKKPSRTHQSFKDECDINNILKRYERTGQLPELIKSNPQYGDFSEAVDYQEAINIVRHAETQFAALPAEVRDRFRNSPEKFLQFVEDPKNGPQLVEMGLATPRQIPEKKIEPQAANKGKDPDPKDPT